MTIGSTTTAPTILLLAEDLLSALLADNLLPQGYQVIHSQAVARAGLELEAVEADLLLGEVRGPQDFAAIVQLRARCAQPMVPVIVFGHGPPPQPLEPGMTWVDSGSSVAMVLEAVRAQLPPIDREREDARRRLPRVGERRR